jgi:hypothetical protein
MAMFDPRTMSMPVQGALAELRREHNGKPTRVKEQKSQAVELYTYLATWGMLRLKAEEQALSQDGKRDVVKAFFHCLETISEADASSLTGDSGLETLKTMDTEEYLGLTGLGLTIAQEFSFWATAVYHDVKGED